MTTDTDSLLLRKFEPVIRYTAGEFFYPMPVEAYVQQCSLWEQHRNQEAVCLLPKGEVSLSRLAKPFTADFGTVHFLRLIDPEEAQTIVIKNLRASVTSTSQPARFRAGRGRLARVGYLSRFIDALFSLSLLARGRVPGDTAAAARSVYDQVIQKNTDHCYYGRVVRQNGWVILQYWFFYLYNDWRTSFFGANDHESDWEMICIYLTESDGDLKEPDLAKVLPRWVAYASHDYFGDDLRRRWDDPEVEKVGWHPVVYAGAGSHASYFTAGEYLTEIELAFLSPLNVITRRTQSFWTTQMRQYGGPNGEEGSHTLGPFFRVPFVDYARGDGLSIGPDQEREWANPILLNQPPAWVSHYRGLWGLYARDPFSGENAPAGPMYNRDGSVRRAWYDPVGWAGLDKAPPPDQALKLIMAQKADVLHRQRTAESEIAEKNQRVQGLVVEATAMQGHPHLASAHTSHRTQIHQLTKQIDQLRAAAAQDDALLEALNSLERDFRSGRTGAQRGHIRRAHHPASDIQLRIGRVAEVWAAASIGLMLVALVAIAWFAQGYLIFGLAGIIALFTFIEAGFRGNLIRLVTSVTIGQAVVASLIILYEFFWPAVIISVLLIGIYMLWENLRELWT